MFKGEDLTTKSEPFTPKGEDIKTKGESLTAKEEIFDSIIAGIPSKVAFTVSIQTPINDKFNEIWSHYQSKHKYGKVYKHQVLQLIIDEVHTKMKGNKTL